MSTLEYYMLKVKNKYLHIFPESIKSGEPPLLMEFRVTSVLVPVPVPSEHPLDL